MKADWPFYVYQFIENDKIAYIGKGSKSRLACQNRRFKAIGHEVARFKIEKDALRHERHLIDNHKPKYNKTRGGDGALSGCSSGYSPSKWIWSGNDTKEQAAELLVRYGYRDLPIEKYRIIRSWLIQKTENKTISLKTIETSTKQA